MTFNGENNIQSAALLAWLRANYQSSAYPGGDGKPLIKDLNFAEMNYYGRIDLDGDVIVPNSYYKKEISTHEELNSLGDDKHYVMPFIEKMYNEVKSNVSFNLNFGKLTPSSREMSTLMPERSFESPSVLYNSYFGSILAEFNEKIIPGEIGRSKVYNFDQYVNHFMKFMSTNYYKSPITLTGWVKSQENSIFGTGLVLEIFSHKKAIFSSSFALRSSLEEFPKIQNFLLKLGICGLNS